MELIFYQLNNKQDAGKFSARIVPIILKWMGILIKADPSWTCPSAMPYGHGLVKVDCPRGEEDGIHVVIQCLYHLENLPKLINLGWRISGSEPKFTSDGFKAAFRNYFPRGNRGMDLPLDKRGWHSKNNPSSIQSRWKLKSIYPNSVVDLSISTEQYLPPS